MKEAIQIAKHKPLLNENEGWYLATEWKNLLRYIEIPVLKRVPKTKDKAKVRQELQNSLAN